MEEERILGPTSSCDRRGNLVTVGEEKEAVEVEVEVVAEEAEAKGD